MRALKFYRTGSLDDLRIEEVPLPTPGPGEVLVQVKAAAVNPSDIKNVQGKMHETTVPRIPGRDFAGIIVQDRARFRVNRFDQSLRDLSDLAMFLGLFSGGVG
jgi:NADPH:quinone reductase